MLRHNFPPGYYEYHGADPPSSSTSSTYYGMQYRVSPLLATYTTSNTFNMTILGMT